MNNMCTTKNLVIYIIASVVYNVACAKKKKTTCKVQDTFNNKFETMNNIYQKSTKATQSSRSSILEGDAIDSGFNNLERKCKWGHTFGFKTMGAREDIIIRNRV